MDIEALIVDRLVSYYARRMADAYMALEIETVKEIRDYILGNYGAAAAAEIAERAMQMIVNN